jgi:cysteine desulfurase family protein (TIGR01976 family)
MSAPVTPAASAPAHSTSAAAAPLDLARVRSHFPALASNEWAFLDNAGGAQVLKSVADRVSDYMLTTSVQLGASYEVSERALQRVTEARQRIALLIGASRADEIVLGPSTTQLMRNLCAAMASQFAPGDEIILTEFDHESNIGPWLPLVERGVVVRIWSLDPETCEIDLAELDRLLSPKTKLVCVTHASNILGTINPVREIADRVHAAGAKLCVDAVAYAPHRAVDVVASGADYYVFSFYKVYGPHFAVMWGRHEHLLDLDTLYHWFYGRDKVPNKLEPGNMNYELAWGTAGITDYVEGLGGGTGRPAIEAAFDAIARHEEAIGEQLLAWLRSRNDIRIIGRRESDRALRVPTISFKAAGRDSAEIVRSVDAHRIGIRFGDFHSRRLVERLGLMEGNGVVRVSMVHYNTPAEIDRLIGALEKALAD